MEASKKQSRLVFALVALCLICLGLAFLNRGDVDIKASDTHLPLFWDEDLFFTALQSATSTDSATECVRGAVIPHHLLAADLIVDLLSRIQPSCVETIVLIGPDHFEQGISSFTTSLKGWATPVGQVSIHQGMIQTLIEQKSVNVHDEAIELEHSLGGIMPFIAHFFPEAIVVPLMVSMETDMQTLTDIAQVLQGMGDEKTMYIASVDFSHYLSSAEAKKRDDVTLQLIKDFDIETLFTLNSQYIDSPKSVVLLMQIMDLLDATDMTALQNTNSGIITGSAHSEVTSYCTVLFK